MRSRRGTLHVSADVADGEHRFLLSARWQDDCVPQPCVKVSLVSCLVVLYPRRHAGREIGVLSAHDSMIVVVIAVAKGRGLNASCPTR